MNRNRYPTSTYFRTVTSTDGTSIAYDVIGSGPAVVLISGGLNQRVMYQKLIDLLQDSYTIFNYDRRGRGDSGDGNPETYTLDHEIDDLEQVLEAVREPAHIVANCTGAIIAAHAAARGIPMAKLALYEPPYAVGGDKPVAGSDYLARLKALIASGRRDEAVMLFQKEAVGNTDEFIEKFRSHPAWPLFAGLAHTLPYERVIVGDGSVPADVMRNVDVPTLVLEGGLSPAWQRNACAVVADLIPGAQRQVIEGQGHVFPLAEVAPLAKQFFGEQ
jgi:pimeloyl-ACP methyl ester carboxylesterase